MAIAKLKEFSGVARLAPKTIESQTTASALRDAAYAYELQILDLRNEVVHRENKLRADYRARVEEILGE